MSVSCRLTHLLSLVLIVGVTAVSVPASAKSKKSSKGKKTVKTQSAAKVSKMPELPARNPLRDHDGGALVNTDSQNPPKGEEPKVEKKKYSNNPGDFVGRLCRREERDPFTCMVCNIYFETGVEKSLEAKVASGRTVLTRANSKNKKRWPSTVCGVVFQGAWNKYPEYTWTRDTGKKNRHGQDLTRLPPVMTKMIRESVHAAEIAFSKGPSGNTHYYAKYLKGKRKPVWASSPLCEKSGTVETHHFYRCKASTEQILWPANGTLLDVSYDPYNQEQNLSMGGASWPWSPEDLVAYDSATGFGDHDQDIEDLLTMVGLDSLTSKPLDEEFEDEEVIHPARIQEDKQIDL